MKDDIHNLYHKLKRVDARIAAMDLPDADRATMLQFRDQCLAEGLGFARILKYMTLLKRLYEHSNGSIIEASPQDIITLLARIELSNLGDWSKYDNKVALRKYLRFCGREDLAKLIRIRTVISVKLPEELLRPAEIQNMMKCCTRDQDRTMIAVLWETGCRIGELLGMQRKHISNDVIGAVLIVNGKTGMRRIRIIESAPYLDGWISGRSLGPDGHVFDITYPTAVKRLKTIARRAGITKRIYPHLFRHSRATFLASHLTEAQLCHYMGWTIGSDMARIYVHLSGVDMDSTLCGLPAVLPAYEV